MIDIPQTLDEWNARGAAFLPGHLALAFSKVEADEVAGEMRVRGEVMSWNGFLHAGAVVTLADTCCGYGTLKALPKGAAGFTTMNLQTQFTGTALEGLVRARATPLHTGRSSQIWDAVVSNEAGRAIAHFRCTQMVLWPKG